MLKKNIKTNSKLLFIVLLTLLIVFNGGTCDAKEIDNNNLEILRDLNVDLDNLEIKDYKDRVIYNNDLKEISGFIDKDVKLDDKTKVVLDENYLIKTIDNIDSSYSQAESNFNTIDEVIDYLKEKFKINDSYHITNENTVDGRTKMFEFSFVKDNIINRFDSYTICVDTLSNRLLYFNKKNIPFDISKEKCIGIDNAYKIAEKKLNNPIFSSMEIINENRPGEFNGKDTSVDNFILVYKFISQDNYIYINSISGEISFVDNFKYQRSTAIGVPDFTTTQASLILAERKLNSMDYNKCYPLITKNLRDDVRSNLLKAPIAFYITSHGSPTKLVTHTHNNSTAEFLISNVPNKNYTFVFLDACSTAKDNRWATAFNINNSSKSKAFIGWKENVGVQESYNFCKAFWRTLARNRSAKSSVISASAETGTYKIKFIGDYKYNGYLP